MSRKSLAAGLRRRYLSLRKKLGPVFIRRENDRIVASLTGILRQTRFQGLCLYKSVCNEPDPAGLARIFGDRRIYYPRVRGDLLEFVEAGTEKNFSRSGFGIPEPCGGRILSEQVFQKPNSVVVFVVPGVVFDRTGGRIGFGKGYYDRSLDLMAKAAGSRIVRIGIAWDFQVRLDPLPLGKRDVRMDMIVTRKKVRKCIRTGRL